LDTALTHPRRLAFRIATALNNVTLEEAHGIAALRTSAAIADARTAVATSIDGRPFFCHGFSAAQIGCGLEVVILFPRGLRNKTACAFSARKMRAQRFQTLKRRRLLNSWWDARRDR
ncbi:MAG TPA: hypothetical protein VGY57_04620, partial [Vicinamibacterales bacterium]|nr:hypothetical protein [Vicinamibacterales bacterium]